MTTAIRYTHVWIGVQTVLRALGQKQTFRSGMSALPPKADMCGATRDVRFVPIADILFSNSSRALGAAASPEPQSTAGVGSKNIANSSRVGGHSIPLR